MAAISDSAIIVLCIVAAGVVVLVGWAVTHRIRAGENGDDERAFYAAESGGTGSQSQFQHMRETRERYKEEIMARFGHRQHNRPRRQSFPMSGAPTSGGAGTSGPSDYSYY
jgi:hypothetical protein